MLQCCAVPGREAYTLSKMSDVITDGMYRAGNGWVYTKAQTSFICFLHVVRKTRYSYKLNKTYKGSAFLSSKIASSASGDSRSSNHVYVRELVDELNVIKDRILALYLNAPQ
jgi:hypothetical protein